MTDTAPTTRPQAADLPAAEEPHLGDTPIWDSLAPRWSQIQELSPRRKPRTAPKMAPRGKTTDRAARAPQAPRETVSRGAPAARPEEAS